MKRQRTCLVLMAGVSIFAFTGTAQAATIDQSGAQVSASPAAADQASVATPSIDPSAQAPTTPGEIVPVEQDVAAQSPAEPEQDILVTGSRLARSTFQTPTPVTAIGEAQLEAKAA